MDQLAMLRRRLAMLERTRRATDAPGAGRFSAGHAAIDAALGGGLARGQLHEVFAADTADTGTAAAFTALLAQAAANGAPTLWLRGDGAERSSGRLYAPGLVELGLDPAALVLTRVPDDRLLLQCAVDALGCKALGAVVIESWGHPRLLDLTASRRLLLASEASGVTAMLLRIGATPTASAADTRWSVGAAASAGLAAQAPGAAMFAIELLRRRGGSGGQHWQMEWDRDQAAFRTPLRGAVVPVAGGEPAVPDTVARAA